MQITTITGRAPEIDQYVERTDQGRLCHLPEWGLAIAQALGHDAFSLVARKHGRICGVLPVAVIKSRLFGNRMVSQAYSNYGGPLGDTAEVVTALLNRLLDLAGARQCPVVEIRSLERLPGDFTLIGDKVCMLLPLLADVDRMWRGLRSEVRNRIRKAERAGLVVVNGGLELLDDFYNVWTVRMRQLGTPCYSRSLFESFLRGLPEYTRVFVVKDRESTLAAGFFHHFKGLAECPWAASRVESNRLSVNTFLYWSAIKYYCLHGEHCFDFGRSTMGSSQYEFKRRCGAKPAQLCYHYWTVPGQRLSMVRPDNPRYETMVEIWKRLPLFVTRLLGPCISRGLP